MIDKSTFGTRTALFHTFGCKLNFAETSTLARSLAGLGVRGVTAGESPDIIVVNTCSVTELADKKCRRTIRSLARRYPDALVMVTGCYAQLKPAEVAAIPGVKIVAGNDRKLDLARLLEEWDREHRPQLDVMDAKDIRRFVPSCSRGDRTRFFLKVQDGCDYWCTYCTIPKARGRSRSGTVAEMVAQARHAAAEGGREIVLTGVNIGDFGRNTGETFIDLIRELDTVEGIERYRISSIEPNLLTDEIIDFVAGSRAFMPHFHIPLQSGSDKVLRLMRRHYDTARYASRIERIRSVIPDAFIGVDLIVGARGEDEAEFGRSRAFVDSLDVSRLHVFPYSERPGTRALELEGVVTPEEKHERTRVMLSMSEHKLAAFSNRFVGTVRPVLFEHRIGDTEYFTGLTDNYLRVRVATDLDLSNCVAHVRIDSVDAAAEEVGATLINNGTAT